MTVLKAGLLAATQLSSSACAGTERPSARVPITNTPGARQISNSSMGNRADSARLVANDMAGRAIVEDAREDDFTTHPSDNSGTRLACGVIIGSALP